MLAGGELELELGAALSGCVCVAGQEEMSTGSEKTSVPVLWFCLICFILAISFLVLHLKREAKECVTWALLLVAPSKANKYFPAANNMAYCKSTIFGRYLADLFGAF